MFKSGSNNLLLAMITLLFGCGAKSSASLLKTDVNSTIAGSYLVTDVEPSSGPPGSLATLTGYGLTEETKITFAGVSVEILSRKTDKEITFKIPAGQPGMQKIEITKANESSNVGFMLLSDDGNPVVAGNASEMCKGQDYYDVNGEKHPGTKECVSTITEKSLTSAMYGNSSVTSEVLAPGSVTEDKIAAGAVGPAAIQAGAVQELNIFEKAVTSTKIADGAILLHHLGNMNCAVNQIIKWNGSTWLCDDDRGLSGAMNITNADLAANAVTSSKILDGEIVDADISGTAAIALSKLSAGTGNFDISGTANNTLNVGAKTAAQIDTSVNATSTATALASANQIVKRDGTGSIFGDSLNAQTKIGVKDSASGYVNFKAPATVGAGYDITLPSAAGSNGDVLVNQGGGVLVWTSAGGSHTHVSGQITDFQAAVTANTEVTANSAHRILTSNPHAVTKAQVGLGNVADLNVQTTWSQIVGQYIGSNEIRSISAAGLTVSNQSSNAGITITDVGDIVIGSSVGAATIDLNIKIRAPEICDIAGTNCVLLTDGILAKAGNLAGLANTTTARSNLGLGTSATANIGVSVGTVATGDHTHAVATGITPGFMSNTDKSALDAADLQISSATSVNTASTLVRRNLLGDFSGSIVSAENSIRLKDSASNYISLQAPASSGNVTYTFPGAAVDNGLLKSNASGLLSWTTISATLPLSYNSNTNLITMSQSDASTSGYLNLTDWNTFNNKQPAITTASAITPGSVQTSNTIGLTLANLNTLAGLTAQLRFNELSSNGGNFLTLKAADAMPADVTLTLPSGGVADGYLLKTDATGQLGFTAPPLTCVAGSYLNSASNCVTAATIVGEGSGVKTSDTATVTSLMIATGSIVDDDISSLAGIDMAKILGLPATLTSKAATVHSHSGADITSGLIPAAALPVASNSAVGAMRATTEFITLNIAGDILSIAATTAATALNATNATNATTAGNASNANNSALLLGRPWADPGAIGSIATPATILTTTRIAVKAAAGPTCDGTNNGTMWTETVSGEILICLDGKRNKLQPESKEHVLFMTRDSYRPVDWGSGLANADLLCKTLAANGGRTDANDFIALLSTSGVNAISRWNPATTVYNTKNEPITLGATFWPNILSNIRVLSVLDEYGFPGEEIFPARNVYLNTGTTITGVNEGNNCANWTNSTSGSFAMRGYLETSSARGFLETAVNGSALVSVGTASDCSFYRHILCVK